MAEYERMEEQPERQFAFMAIHRPKAATPYALFGFGQRRSCFDIPPEIANRVTGCEEREHIRDCGNLGDLGYVKWHFVLRDSSVCPVTTD